MRAQATDFLADEEGLRDLLLLFETGRLDRGIWNHAAHLIVAAAYLTERGLQDTIALLRTRIPAYNDAQGIPNTSTRGYHETLTVFWSTLVERFLRSLPPEMDRLERIRATVERYRSEGQLFRGYWSVDLILSEEARRQWVPPDLVPWD